MRQAGHDRHGLRVGALIAVLWRGGLRISEALALNETDIDQRRGSLSQRQQRQRYRQKRSHRGGRPLSGFRTFESRGLSCQVLP
jgi:integrase